MTGRSSVKVLALAAAVLLRPQAGHCETIQITIQNLVNSPANASAKIGDTVQWINKDIVAHTATARNGDFDVMIGPNKTGSVILKKAGEIDYYCRFHPNMTGHLAVSQN
jgi:plastocyanin